MLGDTSGLLEYRTRVRAVVLMNLFPNACEPHPSPFNRQQFGELGRLPRSSGRGGNEGTSNAVLEALASGRPVVAVHVGGIPDVVRSRVLGTLVVPRSPDALGNALGAALGVPYDPEVIAATASVRSRGKSARQMFGLAAADGGTS